MSENGIYPSSSVKHKARKIARNTGGFTLNILNRNFKASQPNQKWVSDTTYVHTKQGWLYLAAIVDLYSRKIVGWSMAKNNDASLVKQALLMAVKNKLKDQPVLLHSDQGATYRADAYLKLFKENNILQSMSRKGKCHDNAVAESFFNTLKTELTSRDNYLTREHAKSSIFEYIEVFYNKIRRHSFLDYSSPEDFEKKYYNEMRVQ